jgi:hypothetical protein
MSEDRDTRRRDAIGSIARDLRNRVESRGGKLPQHVAEERVRRAIVTGDRKREI